VSSFPESDTGISGKRPTAISGKRITGISGFRDFGNDTQWLLTSTVPESRNPVIPVSFFQESRQPGFSGNRPPGFLDFGIFGTTSGRRIGELVADDAANAKCEQLGSGEVRSANWAVLSK
jgi:hypothetical protein